MVRDNVYSETSIVVDRRFEHPEGLVWDASGERLLWVDVFAGVVVSHHPGSGTIQAWQRGRAVGSVAPRQAGGLVGAVREGFGLLSADGEFRLVTDQLRDLP